MYMKVLGFIFLYLIFVLAICAVMIVAEWKILVKAGEKGWKALIPFYGGYVMFKIAKCTNYFWIALGISIVLEIFLGLVGALLITPKVVVLLLTLAFSAAIIVLEVKFYCKLEKSFGKSGGFAVGLFFLPIVFELILAFGNAKYQNF